MSSIEEAEESDRGEERPFSIPSTAPNISTITEDAEGGRRAKEEGREDSGIPGEECLLLSNPEALVLRPSPKDIATSATSGDRGTKRGGEGETAALAGAATWWGEDGASMAPANLTCHQ